MVKKVSVFIPVYNTEAYVESAVRSAMEQTYPNIEIIIVDDASSDSTYDICLTLAAEDNRIKLFRNERNLGMMANWIHSMPYCTGAYWIKLDADDLWKADMIQSCYDILENDPDVGMVATRFILMDEKGHILPHTEYKFPDFAVNKSISFIPLVEEGVNKMFSYHIAQQGVGLIRREIFDQIGNFTLLPAGDTEMWFRIGAHYKVYCLDKLLHYHRVWSDSFTRQQVLLANKGAVNLYEVRKVILDYYLSHDFISQDLYRRLSKENEYVFDISMSAYFRKNGHHTSALKHLIRSVKAFPAKSMQFYWTRFLNRLCNR